MKFTDTHEWILIEEDGVGTVGISQHACKELGEIVHIQLPKVGQTINMHDEACIIESTKAAADIYSPVSGQVIAVNDLSNGNITKLNKEAESEGWLYKVQISHPHQLHEEHLMNRDQYLKNIGS